MLSCLKLCHVTLLDNVLQFSMGKRLASVHQGLQRYLDLLVKGTAHTRMKAIGVKTTVKTSATSDVGCLTKSLEEEVKKMKM